MKKAGMILAALSVASVAVAQNPPQPRDTMARGGVMPRMGPIDGGQAGPQREQLRQQVEERFGQMVQAQLELNEQQMQRVREAMRASQDRRMAFNRREMDMRRAIGQQLQPGVAAHADSLNRLLAAQAALRTQRAQSDEQFVRDLAFLQPVQRARLLVMIGQFEERMRNVRQRFGPGGPGMQQGQGQGQGPRAGPGERPMRRPGGGGQPRPQGRPDEYEMN